MAVDGLISVIIPAFNAEAFIGLAISSVLSQDVPNCEVIVVDDGSSDATAAIAERFGPRATCIRRSNGGPPAARNQGLAQARGAFIGFLDADDVYEPGALALQSGKLLSNPAADIVVGRMQREALVSQPGEPVRFEEVATEDNISTQLGLCLFRRAVFDRVGRFEESLIQCDDWDWFMRAREMDVPMLLHRELVLRQRLHHNNITRDREANRHFMSMMLKRSLVRRRERSGRAESLPRLSASMEP